MLKKYLIIILSFITVCTFSGCDRQLGAPRSSKVNNFNGDKLTIYTDKHITSYSTIENDSEYVITIHVPK